jgi:lipid A 3-O-deacylase
MKIVAVLLLLPALAFCQSQNSNSQAASDTSRQRSTMSESLPASSLAAGAWDIGIWGQGGGSVSGGTRNTSVGDAGFRIGKILTDEHGSGWVRGNLEYAVDLIPLYVLSGPFKIVPSGVGTCAVGAKCGPLLANETAYGGGFNPFIVRWNFTSGKRLAPFLELGGGVLFTNKDLPLASSNVNFTPQAAIGMNIFTRAKRAVSLDFRYEHISNAGLAKPNPGINTLQGGIGYHWFK